MRGRAVCGEFRAAYVVIRLVAHLLLSLAHIDVILIKMPLKVASVLARLSCKWNVCIGCSLVCFAGI